MSSTVVPLRTADIMETPADGLYDPTKQKSFSVPKEAKPTAALFGSITTVTVGELPSPKTFQLHTGFLTTIPFFRAALSPTNGFKEAMESAVSLPEFEPKIFSYFVQWLYTHDMASAEYSLVHPKLQTKNPAFIHMLKLYKMATFFGCEELKNDCLDMIGKTAEKMNAVPGPEDTQTVWEMEEPCEGLKALILDLFYGMKVETLISEAKDDWHPTFMRDLVVKLKRNPLVAGVPIVKPWNDATLMCTNYHEHITTSKCAVWIGPVTK